MDKVSLVKAVAKKSDSSQRRLHEDLNLFIDEIGKALTNDEKVVLSGLGSFRLRDRMSRAGYDPYHDKTLLIPAGKRISFEPSLRLKEDVARRYTVKSKSQKQEK